MATQLKSAQRGITFLGLLFIGAFLAIIGVIVAQVIPTVIELQAVQKASKKAASEGTVPEIRMAFDKAAQIDDIKSIAGKDLEITKVGDRVVVSYAYEREIHLAGPAWLTLKYAGSSR
ncbi:MAG: DUF4845 domain-containing protein [Gammaproteobacteria bacterium]|nr:DUF4845 domain-containing protein [Gammaproteobacteria bacterium]